MSAPPTGAPGDAHEQPWRPGIDDESPGGAARDVAWEAEAERLRSERPPHWG